ncbi:hypothetical protein AC579_215 [Pseudocercospora musae]|uniref:Uncharacterized protein n=1 Tax=Pseudocercospora musae TaxID=113226 RepID=A0A139I7I6_9PEZI|nr:hypothetical protein AC579_215 [Pseudocercospora musae]
MATVSIIAALPLVALTYCSCFEPNPAFPVPLWDTPVDVQWLEADFSRIEAKIGELFTCEKYNTSSFSIEVTSSERTLWSSFHTAKVQNETRPGEQNVFTTLSILYLHRAGEIDLDDPITEYIPDLNSAEIAQGDLINPALFVSDPVALGLPPASLQGLPTCDEYVQYKRACNRTDFNNRLKQLSPLFAPNQKSSYSNVNYELLGLIVENVTGLNVATGVNWLLPASWATGFNTFYGMLFEIFRTDEILEKSRRPVTFVTKSGGLPGYYSQMMILEEYGIGITSLVAGEVPLLNELVNIITVELVRAIEVAIWENVRQSYSGSYVSTERSLDSSLALDVSSSKGLHLTGFISNDTDVFNSVLPSWGTETLDKERSCFCPTGVDTLLYAGKAINEVVFWSGPDERTLDLPAWNVSLAASKTRSMLLVQP